ncbi:hypothetical protein F4778DRAFT_749438 [Xylariomycetidae sp. FL2044]|nr:hypothetical protein F4778DRAFT_749438 [Xylariomycetidae sp. FL2044]
MDISTTPALAPPDGVTAQFDNPPNGNGIALSSLIVMMVVSTACVLLRAYGKVYLTKKIQPEDVLILLAYGSYWGCAWGSGALLWYPGYFVHTWDLHLDDLILPQYYIFVFGVFYSVDLALLKVSILLDWLRIFSIHGRGYFFWGCVAVITLQTGFGIAAIFLLNFQCLPHEAIWDITIVDKKCLDLNTLQLLSASIHLVSDVAIFLLPQKIIWTLHMSVQKRLGVAVVFGLGALAVICSIFRLTATIDFGRTDDSMYGIGNVVLWATGEVTCGFFVVCMPALPRAVKESNTMRTIVRALGFRASTKGNTGPKRPGYSTDPGAYKMSNVGKSRDAYTEIDEDGTPSSSESTENLRKGEKAQERITRTTEISVTRDAYPERAVNANRTPWSTGV